MAENWGNEMSWVRIEDLRHCLIAAFERLELPHEDAEQVAEVLLDSELRGHESHGVHLIDFLQIVEKREAPGSVAKGLENSKVAVDQRDASSSALAAKSPIPAITCK